MRNASPLLGRKFSEGRLKRHREAVARRKAEGFYVGLNLDPRTETLTLTCAREGCENQFAFTFSPRFPKDKPRYCSHLCQTKANHKLRTRCPADRETLHELYVTKDLTTTEIGKMYGVSASTVRCALLKAGVPRRKGGFRPKVKQC